MLLLLGLVPGQAAERIVMITHGPPDVSLPRESTDNIPARYGIGLPLQVSATQAAVFCNLRTIGPGHWDYEDGTDVFVFDSLSALPRAKPIAISRNEKRADAKSGKARVIVKFPVVGGFWPLGAKAVDGSRHPGEGRGFGMGRSGRSGIHQDRSCGSGCRCQFLRYGSSIW